MWLVESRLSTGVQENVERVACSEDVRRVAIMPDVHLGKLINNGTVVATSRLVYPQAVGSDIGCGYSAISLNSSAEFLEREHHAQRLIKAFYRQVPAFKQRNGQVLPEKLSHRPLSDDRLVKQGRRDGAYQLGTLGCGNHFVELQKDAASRLWLMIHSGSRAMGQIITEHHLAGAATSRTGLKHLDLQSEAGRAYFNDMEWAMQYATLNRLAIMARIVEIMESDFKVDADEASYLDSPHNFARCETDSAEEFIVHRKSAISARQGEPGLIAGSMGSPSFMVTGLGTAESLCSSSHGAGRVLSRTEARARISSAEMQRQLGSVQYDRRHLVALRDEAPAAYRDIRKVMQAQHELTRQHTRLVPVLNFKYPDSPSRRR
jgi:tRNA-splicing ligase RtcB (3'-phosphate/5'-hydroxy nucleic acid ligase)